MRQTILVSAAITFSCLMMMSGCKDEAASPDNVKKQLITNDSLVKRGSYLVKTMVCDDCHSPKRVGPDGVEVIPELRLSGFRQEGALPPLDTNAVKNGWVLFNPDLTAAAGPWGVSFSANLTSDATGIGNWKEEQFFRAIREGKWKGLPDSRSLLPPMPWENFRNASDDDLKAIFAFLKSTNPVKNVVPAPKSVSELSSGK
jgi:hypothetical protein